MTGSLITERAIEHAVGALWPEPDPFATDPAGWVRQRLGKALWSGQARILESVVEHRYTAVQACHAVGKSYGAACLVAYWLSTRPDAFVVWTAPTWSQVASILGRYVQELHAAASLPGRVSLDAQWRWSDGRLVAMGRKPTDNEHGQAAFQGLHARNLLVIVDEACGVERPLWDAVDSLATNPDARVLAIGNPDFAESHFRTVCAPGSGWNVMKVDAFSTPLFTGERVSPDLAATLVSPTWVDERRLRWGESSPLWQSKVLAEFPDSSDETVISPALIRAAHERELPGMVSGVFGCDIARSGRDETVIVRNRGGVLRLEHRAQGHDLMRTSGEISRRLRASDAAAVVDVIGLGAGVYDRLREQGLHAVPFNAAERARRPDKFINRRAEAWWDARERFLAGEVDLDPDDDELAAQLVAVRFGVDSRGRIFIESKDQMRKRGMPSPDLADACVMALASPAGWASNDLPSLVHVAGAGGLTGDLLWMEW